MAREAGLFVARENPTYYGASMACLKAFEDLVAQQATEEANRRANASWTLLWEKMLAAEREACAKVCEGRLQEGLNFEGCATAIRARGNNHEF